MYEGGYFLGVDYIQFDIGTHISPMKCLSYSDQLPMSRVQALHCPWWPLLRSSVCTVCMHHEATIKCIFITRIYIHHMFISSTHTYIYIYIYTYIYLYVYIYYTSRPLYGGGSGVCEYFVYVYIVM